MRAVVDRIENETAVLLFGDEDSKVDIPLKLLPAGTREGSFLQVSFPGREKRYPVSLKS